MKYELAVLTYLGINCYPILTLLYKKPENAKRRHVYMRKIFAKGTRQREMAMDFHLPPTHSFIHSQTL
jgi:hypothetical protein